MKLNVLPREMANFVTPFLLPMGPTAIRWSPRIAALLFTVFIGLFAFDADEGEARRMDLLMHLLPTLFCAGVIALAWTREWIGMLVFLLLAATYIWWARDHVQWILAIALPMLVVAGLYGWAWMQRQRAPVR